MHTYTIVLDYDADEDMFTVTVPGLPGCVTQGRTREESIVRAEEAIRVHLVQRVLGLTRLSKKVEMSGRWSGRVLRGL